LSKNIEKLYDLLVDTLNLILLPAKIDEASYITEIEESLKELEGDYYTFLNKVNLQKLADNNLVSPSVMVVIDGIWTQIHLVKPSLWNPTDFIANPEWLVIREKVKDVLARI
jgi:hypothetical protein